MIPISVTGFNADVVTENSGSPFAVAFDGNDKAWFEAGVGGHSDGLPTNLTIVNGDTGTTFLLQDYSGNNVLHLVGLSPLATLLLDTPGSYSSIAILAASANGGGLGNAVLNFTDLTSLVIAYDAPDWYQPSGSLTIGSVAIDNLGRNADIGVNGTAFTYDGAVIPSPSSFGMVETDIDLTSNTGKILESITFFGQAGDAQQTGIFAVSGTSVPESVSAVPEPGTMTMLGMAGVSYAGYCWRRRKQPVPA